jgi:threonine/homoserine/homoserine lactone efflux protein
MFFDGFVVALFNPKTTLFYVAFLPQFLGADAPLVQGIVLSAIFVGIAAFTDSGYALAAGWLAPLLQRGGVGKVGRWLGGSMFIGLGILAGARK